MKKAMPLALVVQHIPTLESNICWLLGTTSEQGTDKSGNYHMYPMTETLIK